MSRKIPTQELLNNANLTEDEFKKLYIDEEWSLVDFKKYYNYQYEQTKRIINDLGIKKRNISESKKTKRIKNKYKKTIEEKYGEGITNISQAIEVKEKKKATCLKNYGVDNIRKSKEYYVRLHEKMLIKYGAKSVPNINGNANPFGIKSLSYEEQCIRMERARKGYAQWWENLTDEQKNEHIQKKSRQLVTNYDSSLEIKIKQGLENLKIKFKQQFFLERQSFDFFIPDFSTLIEVQGDYWHANPEIYHETDLLNYPNGYKIVKDIWEKDRMKKILGEKYNNRVIYIWEKEIRQMTQPEIMELLIKKMYEN